MNQILRNNIGEKVFTKNTNNKMSISYKLFFIFIMIIISALSFSAGLWVGMKIQKTQIISKSLDKQNSAKIKDYEISLGNFKTQTDAQNFILQFPYLKTTIEKTTLGYIVKLKDKFQLKEAISISKSITTEYKIIPNLVERYYDEKYN